MDFFGLLQQHAAAAQFSFRDGKWHGVLADSTHVKSVLGSDTPARMWDAFLSEVTNTRGTIKNIEACGPDLAAVIAAMSQQLSRGYMHLRSGDRDWMRCTPLEPVKLSVPPELNREGVRLHVCGARDADTNGPQPLLWGLVHEDPCNGVTFAIGHTPGWHSAAIAKPDGSHPSTLPDVLCLFAAHTRN